MPKRKMLTETEQAHIGELREAGWTFRMIAREIGCSKSSVNWCCTKLGIVRKRSALGARGPALVFRSGRPVRRFSADEDARILAQRCAGARYSDLARELDRPVNSIIGRLYTLGRHQAAAEQA